MLQEIADILRGTLVSFRKRKPLSHIDTGTGTAFKVLAPRVPYKLLEIRFKTTTLVAGETLSFTRVSLNPGTMLTYMDYNMYTRDIGTEGVTDVVLTFDNEEGFFDVYDSIVPALSANTGSDRWGLEIVYELT